MSRGLLAHLADRYTFDASPSFADLGAYHVPFDQLVGSSRVEGAIGSAVVRGERLVLLADSGSGKSSVISHALGPTVEGIAPVVVPVRPLETDATRPARVADELLTLLGRYAAEVAELERTAEVRGAFRRVTRSHRYSSGAGLAVGWLRGDLARDITLQTETERPISLAEKTALLGQAFERVQRERLQPIVVFDDTDRWLADTDHDTVAGFLRDTIRWLSELPVSVVVAAHEHYVSDRGERDRLLEFLDTRVQVPRAPDASALAAIIARRVALNVADSTFDGAELDDVADAGAVEALHAAYLDGASLRRVVQLAHIALNEALDSESERVTGDHVVAAQHSG